jgi:hypothetical protein
MMTEEKMEERNTIEGRRREGGREGGREDKVST